MKLKSKALTLVWPYIVIAVASIVYAVGFNWCYKPNEIAFGGITGVAQIINRFLPWAPIGVLVILLNVPLFLLGWRLLGGRALVISLFAMASTSVAIDMVDSIYVFEPMDPMLACIFGGILLGVTLGLVLQQGATTGGTDLIARLLKIKINWLPMGKLLLCTDLVVIVAAAIAFHSLYSALYGLVGLFISSKVIDMVLYGMDNAKVAYIISDHYKEIADTIGSKLERGVTLLHGEGAWSGAEKKVVMCAFKKQQIVHIKVIVNQIDPTAFLIVCEAHEVLGDGFRVYKKDDI